MEGGTAWMTWLWPVRSETSVLPPASVLPEAAECTRWIQGARLARDTFRSCHMKVTVKARWTSLAVPWLRLCLAMRGTRIQFLVGELKSYMPRGN